MRRIRPGRYTAEIEGDFVVFLIGMRLNRPWKVHRWWPVLTAMQRMLRELHRQPQKGLLGAHSALMCGGPAVVQYWRSFDDLDRFARDPGATHLPAWRRFNRTTRGTGDVGIWHETYAVSAGRYEAIYGDMPRVGLAAATGHVPVGKRGEAAAQRIAATPDAAVTAERP